MFKKKILLLGMSILLISGCSYHQSEPKTQPIDQDIHFMYARSHLDKKQKQDYDHIFNTLMEHKKETTLYADSEEAIVKIFDSVLSDHPEIFWSNEFQYQKIDKDDDKKMIFSPAYDYDKDEIKDYNDQLKVISKQILKEAKQKPTDYEKVKYIYDFIINQTEYVDNAPDSQNIISSLINKSSVCAGYAKSVQYLLAQMGIQTALITGNANETYIRHAWNMVKMDNQYYYLDVTYGDNEESQDVNRYRYAYFGMTSDEIKKLYNEISPHETTQATDDTYFTKNQLYFTYYDEARITAMIQKSIQSGERSIFIKSDSLATMQAIQNQLTGEYRIFEILDNYGVVLENVNYFTVPELNCLIYFY